MTEPTSTSPAPKEAEALSAGPFPALHVRRPRERLLEGILLVSGELGYEQITVKDVLERAKVSRGTFYKHFKDKEDCFVQAYVEASEWLYRRVLGLARRQSGWREGLRVGVTELLEFCANQPETAKALFLEAHAAGGEALAQHDRLMGRLAQAIDGARDETGAHHPSPPPTTSAFMVGAIETMISAKLSNGEARKAPEALPGILHFVVMQYFGHEAAWEEMTSAPLATWDSRRRAASEMP
jgi:AcrR family transcriptional regulator